MGKIRQIAASGPQHSATVVATEIPMAGSHQLLEAAPEIVIRKLTAKICPPYGNMVARMSGGAGPTPHGIGKLLVGGRARRSAASCYETARRRAQIWFTGLWLTGRNHDWFLSPWKRRMRCQAR